MPTSRSVVALLVLPLMISAALAANLPRWTDDSAVILTPSPRSFAPALESTNLVWRVLLENEKPTAVSGRGTTSDGLGIAVRSVGVRQGFDSGEASLCAQSWDGSDESGRFLPNGI